MRVYNQDESFLAGHREFLHIIYKAYPVSAPSMSTYFTNTNLTKLRLGTFGVTI